LLILKIEYLDDIVKALKSEIIYSSDVKKKLRVKII